MSGPTLPPAPPGILLTCKKCGQRYRAGTVVAVLTARCLCGGELTAA